MKIFAGAVALVVFAVANPAQAQTRVNPTPTRTNPDRTPGFQATPIDPVIERLIALQAEVDKLKENAGKQVVVLHFTPSEMPGWTDANNNFDANNERAESLCQQALGERYGRPLARLIRPNGDLNYFSHLTCETKL